MKQILLKVLFFLQLVLFAGSNLEAQCPVGWTGAQTNWDWLDYLTSSGNYVPTANYPGVPAGLAANQAFAIGTNRFTIAYSGGIACTLGENTTHTGEAGSYGTGADVNYTGNGNITITFDTVVRNVKFSLYDVDANARTQLAATDASGANINVTLSPASGLWLTSVFVPNPLTSINTSVGVNPRVDATFNPANQANNVNKAAVNVDVAGPVKTITITVSNNATDPNFWLSDISACIFRTFPNNYFADARPFTGQPTFILATPDSTTVHYIDTATAKAKYLFAANLAADANAPKFVNGLGYDHKKHFLYYVHDFGSKAYNTRALRRWDYNTETIDVSMAVDVNTLGIPTFDQGVESGGSSFYDGCLYFGIEGQNSSNNSNRETIVWRIEFNSSNVPVKSCQVFATPADNGAGTFLIDWSDFAVKDGILYNFNGISNAANRRYQHFNLQTGNMDNTYTPVGTSNQPRQAGITWSGALINTYDSIATYNGAGAIILPKKKILGTSPANMSPDWAKGIGPGGLGIGASGDATGPFKTKTDFGDAPATYDPATSDPATHEIDSTLHIGAAEDKEFGKKGLTSVEDVYDDGLAFVPIFSPTAGTYAAQVSVYNNTGSNATLLAWLDYDGNNVFDAAEACNTVTVSSGTALQSLWLIWPSTPSTLPNGSYTYLRIRITSAVNGMTGANPTGYYNNGEVEDYQVVVSTTILSVNLLLFDAKVSGNKTVKLNWSSTVEAELRGYDIERSGDGINYRSIAFADAKGNYQAGTIVYNYEDVNALKGKSYYRLKVVNGDGQFRYSEIKNVMIKDIMEEIRMVPNPAHSMSSVYIKSNFNGDVSVYILDLQGQKVKKQNFGVITGANTLVLDNLDKLPDGTYIVKIIAGDMIINRKLIIKK